MAEKQRFGGIARLYGEQQFALLQRAHFCVIGIGGVGSWAAEALARTGVGNITLIDMDDICTTNTNRQIHALTNTVGATKVDVMADRITAISPDCRVKAVEDFVTPDNVSTLITAEFDMVIEATDSIQAKAAIIAFCKRNKIGIVTVGGAGGQVDPRQITSGDLAKTTQDPLSAKLRSELRRFYNFSKNTQRRFGIECVYSTEQLRYPQPDGSVAFNKSITQGSARLDCSSGFGASTMVTASFGMVAAARGVEKWLAKQT
ncbi:tRNA cyclic N6-threonylcarbamoyladenosine(37) synthase TcdA [Alteromonas oceanisediminis]|uniref:tRNA cyclic N6-threonylcarbamoyladenosine(37) synthase TcdA n=1 Tax=Alteromonas oceanisediminis TaxID=2836180 RepID=UPI001BDB4571|nr:tRNA cyclic N6-threonylcarbamoyladenosine(37) synthase TcdA [Alteromonas oceanisediminis]MBT0586491.1 tRNA cyclic N6-threonylcarbamoyladenosine(37) synthase TcdA [Alteromonas oceanisediminis]